MPISSAALPEAPLMLAQSPLSLRLLEVFLAVAQEGSMKGAADRLNLSQASISQSVTALEQALAVRLLDRSVKPPALTFDGERAVRYAAEVTKKVHELEDAMRHGVGRPLPLLRMGMINSFAALGGAAVLKAMRHVADEWTIESGGEATRFKSLLERRVDLVITSDDSAVPEGVVALTILRESFIVAVPASYDPRVRDLRRIATDLDFIRFGHHSHMASAINSHLNALSINPTRRYHFDTPDAALNLVAAGLGWAIVTPLLCLRSRLAPDAVRLIEIKPAIGRSMCVAMRRSDGIEIAEHIRGAVITAITTDILPQMKSLYPALARQIRLAPKF